MPLSDQQVKTLATAIKNYSYPKVLYDFKTHKEFSYLSMRKLETAIRADLRSGDPDVVKRGLSNVLYWGHRRAGYYMDRVNNFRHNVTRDQLREAAQVLVKLEGAGLLALNGLRIPQFSNLSFLSKVRMFVDPRKWVVLDRGLMSLADFKVGPFCHIKQYKTYIPCTSENEQRYEEWSNICRRAALSYYSGQGCLTVDVERGIFQLVADKQHSLAAEIVASL